MDRTFVLVFLQLTLAWTKHLCWYSCSWPYHGPHICVGIPAVGLIMDQTFVLVFLQLALTWTKHLCWYSCSWPYHGPNICVGIPAVSRNMDQTFVLVFLQLALAWTKGSFYIHDTRLNVHSCCSVSTRPCPCLQWHCCPAHFEVLTALLLTVHSAMWRYLFGWEGSQCIRLLGSSWSAWPLKALRSFETSGTSRLTVRRRMPQDLNLHVWFLAVVLTACNSSTVEWGSSIDDVWLS
jgi:hypothetical protein